MLDSVIQTLNEAGQTWWSYVFPLTWTSSLVAAILLAVVWIGRRWPAQLRYAIVLIALIKFAIPPTLTAPIGLFNWFGPTIIERTESCTVSEQSTDAQTNNYSWSTILSVWERLSWRAQLMLLHAVGCILAGAWAISRLIRLTSITRGATHVKTGKWYDLFARLSKQLGLSRPVSLLVSSEAVPPMAFGLLRPCVMVPVSVLQDLPSRQIKTMLAHELAHHKRTDLWVNALQNVLGILWWFNPLIRLLNQVIRRIREDCCDDLLLCRKIATDSKYCQALLQIASNLNRSARIVAALGFAEAIHPLGRRINRIMDPQIYRWAQLSFGTVVPIAILAALVLPGLRSERSTVSTDTTPLTLEIPALTKPQVAVGVSEQLVYPEGHLSPVDTRGKSGQIAGGFPQQINSIQPRVYPTAIVQATSNKITVSPTNNLNEDKAVQRSHDSFTDITMTATAGDLNTINNERSRHDNTSQSMPSVSSVFPGYSSRSDGGADSGLVAEDASASDILAARQVSEEPSINLAAAPLAKNVSEQYSPSLTSSAEQWLSNSPISTALDNLVELTGVLGPLEPPLALSSFFAAPSISSALIGALDTGTPYNVDEFPDDKVLLASATPVTHFGDTADSVEDETGAGMVLASSLDIGDSYQSYYSPFDTNAFGLSNSAEVINTIDVTDSVVLAYADVPASIDFAGSLVRTSSNNNFITNSLSNPAGTGLLDGFDTIPDAMASYSQASIPEPMTSWALLAGSLLLSCRRQKANRDRPRNTIPV